MARVRVMIRRIVTTTTKEIIEIQGLILDPSSHRVIVNEQVLAMGPTEFKLLHFLWHVQSEFIIVNNC